MRDNKRGTIEDRAFEERLLAAAAAERAAVSPGMTDLMVTPEALDAYLVEYPPCCGDPGDCECHQPTATGGELTTLARQLAIVGHAGQSRKGIGEPYYNHVKRVAKSVQRLGWKAMTVAYLHDLVEDTPITCGTLYQLGFPTDIVEDVSSLTRRSGETYADFIARGCLGSTNARQVKLADLHDNLSDDWTNQQGSLRDRYVRADADLRYTMLLKGVTPLVFA